jgi:hypothetical protein
VIDKTLIKVEGLRLNFQRYCLLLGVGENAVIQDCFA